MQILLNSYISLHYIVWFHAQFKVVYSFTTFTYIETSRVRTVLKSPWIPFFLEKSLNFCTSPWKVCEFSSILNPFPVGGTHITRDMCFRGGGTHITRDTCSQPGEHISLGIHVPQVGEHISLGICVSQLGEHISLGIRVSQVRGCISVRICIPMQRNTYH